MKYLCPKCKNELENIKKDLNNNSLDYKCKKCGYLYYFNKDINKMVELIHMNYIYKKSK